MTSSISNYQNILQPLRVGIVGSGFVAKLRAEILSQDSRIQLVAIAGTPIKAQAIAQEFAIPNV